MKIHNIVTEEEKDMKKVYKAPEKINWDSVGKTMFLAGSIDMGKAVDWQTKVTEMLDDHDVVVLNPRRDDWDSSWEQKKENKQFNEQVTWELECQEKADILYIFFSNDSQAPITLLELGLFCKKDNVVVCCEPKYWRRGNVEIVCDRYDVPLFDKLDASINALKKLV